MSANQGGNNHKAPSKRDQPYGKLRGVSAFFGLGEEEDPSAPEENLEPPAMGEPGVGGIPKIQGDRTLPLGAIVLPAEQPRRYFDPEKLHQLAESIRHHGILEPLLVRPLPQDPERYELVAGERRLRAAQSLGLETVPVVVRSFSDGEAIQIALIENLQREDLNPVEETEGILKLLGLRLNLGIEAVSALLYRMRNESIGNSNQNVLITPEATAIQEIFSALGLLSWESFTTTRLPLLKLPEEVLEALRSGRIAYTKAQVIARIPHPQQRRDMLEQAIAGNWSLAHLKAMIKALPPDGGPLLEPDPSAPPSLQQRFDQAYRQVKQSKVWADPKKRKQVERLVTLLESLATPDA